MEKIKLEEDKEYSAAELAIECAEKINKIIDWVNEPIISGDNGVLDNRLKTLEDKVKFIMEKVIKNPDEEKAHHVALGNFSQTVKHPTLQDLWDEENENLIEKETKQGYGHAHIPGIPCSWCSIKPTDKSEKIEEIISGCKDKYVAGYFMDFNYFKKFESWLRDKLRNL